MAPGWPIHDRELEATAKGQGARIEPGDGALVRTGWINR